MSLSGLLAIMTDDPQLRPALEHAALRAAGGGDLVAPPSLRPVLAAALTGHGDISDDAGIRGRPVRAGRHRHGAGGRGPGRRAQLAAAARHRRVLPGLGDAAARAAVAPLGHLRASAGRAAPARPPRPADSRTGPLLAVGDAAAQPAPADGRRPGRAGARRPGDRPGRRPGGGRQPAGRDRLLPAPSWWRSAATSPSAAASWTCSRPPTSTRCGWSSGATRSRRSATSRWPTSAAWRWPPTACGRRRAASCCSPPTCAAGPGSSPPSGRASARCSARSPRASRSRAWRRSRPC